MSSSLLGDMLRISYRESPRGNPVRQHPLLWFVVLTVESCKIDSRPSDMVGWVYIYIYIYKIN